MALLTGMQQGQAEAQAQAAAAAAGGLAGQLGVQQTFQQSFPQMGGLPQNANDWFCPGCADKQFGKNQQCRNCGTPKELGVSDISMIPDVIDKFLGGKVDANVDAQFRNLDPAMQKTIIERGSLVTARDPSAVLRTRMGELGMMAMRAPRQQQAYQGGFDSVQLPSVNDPQAPRAGDWYCSNCQDLQFGKNTACRRCGLPREQVDHGKPQLDPATFVAPFNIDEDKKAAFLAMDFALQEQIMLKGSLAGARDPTAVLCQRMGQAIASVKAQRQLSQMSLGGKGSQGPRQGDWYCSICNDLQFAKNEACRTCNTPRALADTGEVPKLDANQWIAGFQIDEDKKQQFLNMTVAMQEAIISEGTLHGARDPTAVLVSRMNKQCKISKGMYKGAGGSSFGPAGGKSNMSMDGAMGGAGPYGGSGAGYDGSGSGGYSEEEEWAWVAYAKGFLQAIKGKGKGK
jgi:hypothetical protein